MVATVGAARTLRLQPWPFCAQVSTLRRSPGPEAASRSWSASDGEWAASETVQPSTVRTCGYSGKEHQDKVVSNNATQMNPLMRRRALVLLWAIIWLSGCTGGGPAGQLNAYLEAAAGAEPDRGWQHLSEATREVGYGNDEEQYIRDAAAADWSAFQWSPAVVAWEDDGFSRVELDLLSGPASVPAFLLANRVLNGRCEGDDFQPIGLLAFVDGRPFGSPGLGGGGWTGSQLDCNGRFIGDAAFDEPAP